MKVKGLCASPEEKDPSTASFISLCYESVHAPDIRQAYKISDVHEKTSQPANCIISRDSIK